MYRNPRLWRMGIGFWLLGSSVIATNLHAAPIGPNLALNKATAVSSSYSSATRGDKAVDGNIASYWRTRSRSTLISEWIQVDLGSVVSISQVVLNWNIYYATRYDIEVSQDNFLWNTVYAVGAENGGTDTIDFAATTARFVRMSSRAWNNDRQRIRLNEFEVYADDGAQPPPPVAGAWSVVSSANGEQVRNTLNGVSVIASDDVWAVGVTSNLNSSTKNTLAEHWDGNQWSVLPTPNPDIDQFGSRNELLGVAASSSTDVWAVGVQAGRRIADGRTLVLHWDGASWSDVPGPNITNAQTQLNAVAALSSIEAWAVGSYSSTATNGNAQPLIGRWNGSFWSVVPTPTVGIQTELRGIAAISSNNIWAVGRVYDESGTKPLVMRWNGISWSVATLPASLVSNLGTSGLTSVTAVSASELWAVGSSGGNNLTLRYNGNSWSVVPSPNDTTFIGMNNSLYGVSAVAGNDVWAVGYSTRSVYGPGDSGRFYDFTTILHWNGSAWSMVDSPDPGTTSNRLFAVSPVNANELWAVGSADFNNTMTQRYTAP